MKNIIFIIFSIFIVTGCSYKSEYKPEKVDAKLQYDKGNLDSKIVNISREGVTYLDGSVITKDDGLLGIKIPKGFYFVNSSKNFIIIANDAGRVKILSKGGEEFFNENFDHQLASATVSGNLLAMLFINNTIVLYDIKESKIIYEEKLSSVNALDARVANPIFLNDLVVFPTLDGRLLIMDSQKKIVLRDVAISDRDLFNNVIFLGVMKNIMVGATPSKVIAINPDSIESYSIDIRDIVYDDSGIYIFSKAGEIVLLDGMLKVKKRIKFPHAVFSAIFAKDRLYAVEREGYLIEIDRDLESYRILKLPSRVDKPLFIYGDKIYFDNRYIEIK